MLSAQRIAKVLDNAWAPATRAKYNSSVSLYLRWCSLEGIPRDKRLPASEISLCSFAAHHAGKMAGSTIRSHLSGLKRWHILNNFEYGSSPRLKYLLKAADNMTPGTSKQAPRPPVTLAMLRALHNCLDLSGGLDACIMAAATVAFWGQARLGELLSSSEKHFYPTRIPSRSNLHEPSTSAGSRKLHLPSTKTKGARGEDIFICRQNGRTDPISALDAHLKVNKLSPTLPLFSYDIGNGRHLALTRRRFLARCVPPDVVKALGRWSSDAFLRYWRSLELIAPLHAERLDPTERRSLPQAGHGPVG
ncbi:hypothetical protein BD779DRAFT_1614627 [Infundibulicybe gibba]|nr:hypothetical protein BD779DRAFT_1614627 [Infundibulicybe gibba]